MIISAASDYRAAAQARLPPFLFHYIDGGAYAEHTLRRNVSDLADVALRQRVLRNMSDLRLSTELFGETLAMPVALALMLYPPSAGARERLTIVSLPSTDANVFPFRLARFLSMGEPADMES